jgi:hypothetical protein
MADVSKLKRKTLGAPPSMEEASTNLYAPEAVAPFARAAMPGPEPIRRMDGRSARRTNRTLQFATRVRPEWDAELRSLAQRDGLLLVEVLERALDLYKTNRLAEK